MSTERFNRLHFHKRFDFNKDFVAIKTFSTSGIDYKPGMPFDKSVMPEHKVKSMFYARKITYSDATFKEVNLVPEIKKGAFGWLTVVVDGKQIGNKTKSIEEANEIINEWLKSKE